MSQASFLPIELTSYEKQLGADVKIKMDNDTFTINVFVCAIEGFKLKCQFEDKDFFSIDITVTESEYKQPKFELSEDKASAFITFDNHQAHINLADEGIIADIWDLCSSDGGVVDSCYIYYNELTEEE